MPLCNHDLNKYRYLMVTIIYMYHDDLNEMPLHNDYLNEISFILTACMHVHARC